MVLPSHVTDLLSSHIAIAASLEIVDGFQRWIFVDPIAFDLETKKAITLTQKEIWRTKESRQYYRKYRIRYFGVPIGFDAVQYDLDEEHILNHVYVLVGTLAEVDFVLSHCMNDPAIFQVATVTRCPL